MPKQGMCMPGNYPGVQGHDFCMGEHDVPMPEHEFQCQDMIWHVDYSGPAESAGSNGAFFVQNEEKLQIWAFLRLRA